MVFYPKFEGNAVMARGKAAEAIVQRAMKELNVGRSEVVLRPLRPIDVGLGGGTWATVEIGTTLTSYSNASIANNTWISIFGLMLAQGPSMANTGAAALIGGSVDALVARNEIQRVQIQREASTTRDWDITAIPFYQSQTGWADDAVTVNQNTNLTIQFEASAATTLDQRKHAFLGDAVDRKGITINP